MNGLESQVAVNVVSTLLLSLLLLPKLKKTGAEHPGVTPHLAIVASDTHMAVTLNKQNRDKSTPLLEQLSNKKSFSIPFSYPTSKLLDVLMTSQLANQVGQDYPVIINCMNPGLCKSELQRSSPAVTSVVANAVFAAREPEIGVRSYIAGIAGGRELHGKYISDGIESEVGIGAKGPKADEIGKRLWRELVERMEVIEPGIMSRL